MRYNLTWVLKLCPLPTSFLSRDAIGIIRL